ncbi:hypothetical protein H696_02863 [Fonticula alba]|uniref:rhomboid protease n=1 Tax=Fonticula alba TaxID=691883 RepID=A0A058Z8A4_FONAL|nr:hypothetical protein H696_02863 [Fonticula alba]KCV70514.1 hypothetical protein H696_02863 [Fonticula alba]|eukprot:XP_009495030.1 hypothetical protein H696_02863 [Fonticula alba]
MSKGAPGPQAYEMAVLKAPPSTQAHPADRPDLGFTFATIESLLRCFALLDLDGDGLIQLLELRILFRAFKTGYDENFTRSVLSMFDFDRSGSIEHEDFLSRMALLQHRDPVIFSKLLAKVNSDADNTELTRYTLGCMVKLVTINQLRRRSSLYVRDTPQSTGSGIQYHTIRAAKRAVGLEDSKTAMPTHVQKQLVDERKRTNQRIPWFLYLITVVQVAMVITSLFMNKGIQPIGENLMIGPSNQILLHLGAKFGPCMRPEPWVVAEFPDTFPCPPEYQGTYQPKLPGGECTYYMVLEEKCGMGGFGMMDSIPLQAWRFITPMFLHTGAIHLIINMIFTSWRGLDIEKKIGSFRFMIIFCLSGIFGIAFSAAMTPNQIACGSSASLFSLLAILKIDLFLNWRVVQNPWRHLFTLVAVAVILLGIGLLPFVDNFMQIGGYIAGILSAVILVPHIKISAAGRRWRVFAIICALLILAGIFFGVFYTFYDGQETNYCWWCEALNCMPQGTPWCAGVSS